MSGILITGGTGSFGRAFTRTALDKQWFERICILSRDEHKQAEMRADFKDDERLRFFIGDVRDRDRLRRAMTGCTHVVHAAALKRIEVGVYNPAEMVKTNVLGAMNVIEAAQDAPGVLGVVYLSTDKAVEPVSPYGQSKALAESLFLAANNTVADGSPRFMVTRYGNVAGSNGSVIPLWRDHLKKGDVVRVSDPEATRFWMFMHEAVDLVARALDAGEPGPVIPDLPAFALSDLAAAMGVTRMDVYGLKPFEKKHESLRPGLTSDKARRMSVPEIREALAHV